MDAPQAAWLDPDEMHAWVNLIKLASRIVTLSDNELRRTRGITGRDYELLHHVSSARDGLRVSDLADLIDDTSSCITHRINRLQGAGLVAKGPDPDDRRARCVRLTEAGRSLLEDTAPEHVARVRGWVIDPLERADVVELGRIAGVLREHLQSGAALPDDRRPGGLSPTSCGAVAGGPA